MSHSESIGNNLIIILRIMSEQIELEIIGIGNGKTNIIY